MSKNAIIIFIKNPKLGKVKTRLAATVGNQRALEIYHLLLAYTQKITQYLTAKKYLYYTDFIDKNDNWSNEMYHKMLQSQGDLGLKMAEAFREIHKIGHTKVLIIGSDCLEISATIINDAFTKLIDNEVVIGPAFDGGYYLIGFDFEKIKNQYEDVLEKLFLNKEWSHQKVCQEAINACEALHLKYNQLPMLTDIDEEKDFLKTFSQLNKSS